MGSLSITYFGILRAPTSWAKVGREMCNALLDIGTELHIYERKGFLYDSCMPLSQAMEERIGNCFRPEPVFTFEHPSAYRYLQGGLKVGLLTYESSVVPTAWIKNVDTFLDLLVLPSGFCRDLFVQAGVSKQKCAVIPYGYRPDIYYKTSPVGKTQKEDVCRFITVSSPHKREGLDVLLDAYRLAFSSRDDVSLTIKVNYLPHGRGRPFEIHGLTQAIETYCTKGVHPPVALVSDFLTEKGMGDLYRSCTCFVSATRGEGFGMAFLEALACGLELVVTGWGGHLDFLNEQNARLVAYRLRKAKEIQYDCQDRNALIAEPDKRDLAEKMRSVYNAYTSGASKKRGNDVNLDQYAWCRIAQRFMGLISDAGGYA